MTFLTVFATILGILLTDGTSKPLPLVPPIVRHSQTVPVVEKQVGKASYYYGSRGFHGRPHVAMHDGHWTGKINRWVLVTINGETHKLPVVDYCQCHVGEKIEKLIDLSSETVELFGLDPDMGVYDVTVRELSK